MPRTYGTVFVSGDPYPKTAQLARKERRYTRKVASPKRWQAIADAKQGPCRGGCGAQPPNELHHIISRSSGGSDTESNVAPVCSECHGLITRRDAATIQSFVANLTDAEYAYSIQHGGEDFFERAYGLVYSRG